MFTNKKFKLGVTIIALCIAIWAIYISVDTMRNRAASEQVMNYLVNEKGYAPSDIAEIKTTNGKASPILTTIIFRDEPNAMYFYTVRDRKVLQINYVPAIYDYKQTYKHAEHPI